MRRSLRRALAVTAVTLTLLALAHTPPSHAADAPYDVLVFSKTAGFRHDSIPAGIQAIRELGAANNFTVTATEDANAFTTANLAQYEAVVWLSTTGDVLNDTQQTAFQSYISTGKGYVGVHAAADTEYGWSFYGSLMGAYFASHPAIQQATINVESRGTAATAHLGTTWTRTDEWYNYQTNVRSSARVLAALNESSYSGGTMAGDHPISWCKTFGGGRSFYTGLGHTIESYSEANFRNHLLGGIRYAAGTTKIDCRPETGYTTLYNGSTTGWSQAGPGAFTNSNSTLTSSGGLGMLWYSAREFGSYSLKLDWMMPGDDNSGIFVGFPASSDPNSAINNGYEIQIDATDTPDRTTGSIYSFQTANIAARDAALNPPGEWNTYEILVEGERLRVYLNGTLINDFTNTVPARSLVQGYIGIQNHGAGDDVSFRNIRIRELGGPPQGNRIEAESFSSQFGTQNVADAAASGGVRVGYIDNNDWLGFASVNASGRTGITARVASGGTGGQIQVRTGSQTGPVIGTVNVVNTGGYGNFVDVSASLSAGSGPVFLVFVGTGGGLFDVDNFLLTGSGGGDTTPPSVPGNMRSTGTTANSVSLAWNASTDNVGVTGYDVFRENGATDILAGSPTGTTLTVGGLAASTAYQFYVVAKDAAGNRSGPSNVVTATTTGQPPSPNLALNRPATASSSCNANEGPAKAVNGTVNGGNTDKWCAVTATKWWQVDLGSSLSVSRFVVRHAGAGGENAAWNTRDYDIQVSTNGTTWTTVSQVRGNTANVSTHTIAATQARYVRMNVLVPTSNTDAAARVYEFEVYAS